MDSSGQFTTEAELRAEVERLSEENRQLRDLIKGYDDILKLNEQEIDNAESIIEMYEQIMEFARLEMKNANETVKAHEKASQLSNEELDTAFKKIKDLEVTARSLKDQKRACK